MTVQPFQSHMKTSSTFTFLAINSETGRKKKKKKKDKCWLAKYQEIMRCPDGWIQIFGLLLELLEFDLTLFCLVCALNA